MYIITFVYKGRYRAFVLQFISALVALRADAEA